MNSVSDVTIKKAFGGELFAATRITLLQIRWYRFLCHSQRYIDAATNRAARKLKKN
jgi:hypothetical protein